MAPKPNARATTPTTSFSQPVASSPFKQTISSATRGGKSLSLGQPTLVESFVEAHLSEIPDGFDFQRVEKLRDEISSSSAPLNPICALLNEVGKLVDGETLSVRDSHLTQSNMHI